jgi:CDP-paratose 2-epimerase
MKTYLITGGCGFVGSSLALQLQKHYSDIKIICLDNLRRRGSELNISRLKKNGIEFVHGDIRNKEDLESVGKIDVILECSAEPSVLAGYDSSPEYLINTNLLGTINCLELARKREADFIFLSTSRVYPVSTINNLKIRETGSRFELEDHQEIPGASGKGVSEDFPLNGARSLYGATKLSSELIIQEYVSMYNLRGVINRCGVLTGPWQFGKADQGVIVLWMTRHFWKQNLSYIGFGGEGKQVRDILHVDDLYNLLDIQLNSMDKHSGEIYNVGGGREISVSLQELTGFCAKISNNTISMSQVKENRNADIPIYLTDNTKVTQATGWKPTTTPETILSDIHKWIEENEPALRDIFL